MHLFRRKPYLPQDKCECAMSSILTSIHLDFSSVSYPVLPRLSHTMSFATLDGCFEDADRYLLAKIRRGISRLKENRIIPVLRLPLAVHIPVTTPFCEEAKSLGYEGILLSSPHTEKSIYPLLEEALHTIRENQLFAAVSLPLTRLPAVSAFMQEFEPLADFIYLDIPPKKDLLATIEGLTDVTTKRGRFHTLIGCREIKRSHALQHDFLDVMKGVFERVSYGCFAGIHLPLDALSWELLSCFTSSFHIQKGYQTALPRSDR